MKNNAKKIILLLLDVLLILIIIIEGKMLLDKRGLQEESNNATEVQSEMITFESETTRYEVEETEGETKTETEEQAYSREQVQANIEDIIAKTDVDATWEIYAANTDDVNIIEKSAGVNVIAGDIKYLFLADQLNGNYSEQVTEMIQTDSEVIFNELLESSSWEQVTEKGYTSTVSRYDEEGHPQIYTSALDGAKLVESIKNKQDETLIQAIMGREAGQVSKVIADESVQILEYSSTDETSQRCFASISTEDGGLYHIGIMVDISNSENLEEIQAAISEILLMLHSYYTNNVTSMKEAEIELSDLKNELNNQIASYQGNANIYVQDLKTGQSIEIMHAEQKNRAASLIKLYIMAAVYDKINKGELTVTDDITKNLNIMITESDNEASNWLVGALAGGDWQAGSQIVNQYISENGYMDTNLGRKLLQENPTGENYTSVQDCGKLLNAIYSGTCVSKEYSAKMYELLKAQKRTHKIPSGISGAMSVANKTGELSDVQHDVAIVQVDTDQAYILCVMSFEITDENAAFSNISSISSTVYRCFGA